jgi:protein-tyrosine phosphatase
VIDIHSHVLYGLDDGSPDLETSLDMLRMAGRHGTTDIVASPHANLEYKYDAGLIAERKAALDAANDSGVRVHLGCDFHLQYENIEDALKQPRKYTIAGGPYLLVEFSDLLILKNTTQIFDDLLSAGMIPVMTHPERNQLLQHRLKDLTGWVEMGCSIQVTGQSLDGQFGGRAKQFSETLMNAGLVHFIASDAHDLKRRPPVLDSAFALVAKRWDPETAEILFRGNPAAVLAGKPLVGASIPRKRGFFSFLR